jgi:hypothetical protein
MGDNFLKQQVENSRRGRDRAVAEMERPTLFSRPDIVNTSYPVIPLDGVTLEDGEVLNAFANGPGQIDLARCHQQVGRMEGEAAGVLRDAMCQDGAGGFVQVRINEVCPLSGVAQARIVEE